jgi:diacylglycerol kinase family enzyme
MPILGIVKPYTSISIIYNPTSTGASRANAFKLADELEAADVNLPVYVVPTDFAGHAESLAYDLAKATKRPLIISSSGDGGYNEVINGALRAQAEGAKPTCGLLPSGNANDHYRNLHQHPITDQILDGKHRYIDILKLSAERHGQPWERFAHSYIGIGLTPKVGIELNKVQLNRLREAWIVAKTLYKLRPSRLIVHGKEHTYDSLIFSNVSKMSKILSVSDSAELTDGKFEVVAFPSQNKMRLLRQLVQASTFGLHSSRQADHYTFTTVRPTRVQLDGEIFRIDGGSVARITVEPRVLRCII